jgi:hypothetical protein
MTSNRSHGVDDGASAWRRELAGRSGGERGGRLAERGVGTGAVADHLHGFDSIAASGDVRALHELGPVAMSSARSASVAAMASGS